MEEKIKFCIDTIEKSKKKKTLIIRGWAFISEEQKVPEIQVINADVDELSWYSRSDVNQLYDLPEECHSGFQLVIKNFTKKNDCQIVFSNGKEKVDYFVPLDCKYPVPPSEITNWTKYRLKLIKGMKYLKRNGLRNTFRRVKIEQQKDPQLYQKWIEKFENYNNDEMEKQIESFSLHPKISILIPVYNVEKKWLDVCIQSIKNQSYSNWELCLADDASTKSYIRPLLESYAENDKRIKVVFREENGHICEATNSALEIATGEYIALIDNDDEIPKNALFEVVKAINDNQNAALIYSDEDKIDEKGIRSDPAFKPDWSPDLLLGTNYISHLGVYRTDIAKEIGGFRKGYEGAQDYDFVLRFVEKIQPNQIVHISKVLYHWRMVQTSTAVNQDSKGYAFEAGRLAVADALKRRGIAGSVRHAAGNGLYDVDYQILKKEKVSIIIPTRDGYEDLKRCLASILNKTTYPNYEIIVADNGTTAPAVLELFKEYQEKLGARFIVERIDIPFNYSRINNLAAKKAQGEYLLFLNNDTEVISPDWLDKMVSFCQFDRIGAVGAKLYYPNHTIQHAGVVLGLGGAAGHGHHTFPQGDFGYFGRLEINVNYMAVTAACLMIKKKDFELLDGFNEELVVAFNDVDLCIRAHEVLKKENVWLHGVELYHYESQSRGPEDTPEKKARFQKETQYMYDKWGDLIENDPYYNPNLTRSGGNYAVREC